MSTVFLIHGGLWDSMDAERFWRTPGVVAGLESRGLSVLAPDHPPKADGWSAEVTALSKLLPDERFVLSGCPEPPSPHFAQHAGDLVAALAGFVRGSGT